MPHTVRSSRQLFVQFILSKANRRSERNWDKKKHICFLSIPAMTFKH